MPEPRRIAGLGVEGGGEEIFGERRDDGRWTFWVEGTTMNLDENDDEFWTAWRSSPSDDLAALLPDFWPFMSPLWIDPEFIPWFRDRLAAAIEAHVQSGRSAPRVSRRWSDWFDGTHARTGRPAADASQ